MDEEENLDSPVEGELSGIDICWPAPDRDSPQLGGFEGKFEPAEKFGIFLQMEGLQGRSEEAVLAQTGVALKRPRRWHKIFERMGLLYPGEGNTRLARMGRVLRDAAAPNGLERIIGREALETLKRYQFDNPIEKALPEGCDVHPYFAVLKCASMLDWKLHWDEVNRELMRLLRDDQIPDVIAKIANARLHPEYDTFLGTSSNEEGLLSARTHPADAEAPEGKTPEGQVRDQKMTPFLKRAGFGEMFLKSPGASGGGYWTVPEGVRDIVIDSLARPPVARKFNTEQEWIEWFCEGTETVVPATPPEKPPISKTPVKNLTLDTLRSALNEYDPDLVFSDTLLASVVAALRSGDGRNFIILRGVSGTGKTRIVSAIAKAVYGTNAVDLPYLTVIEVRPDWTDGSYLLGHYDPIEARYVRQRFLDALLAADRALKADPDSPAPVFVCLDEMNLARVEYYLADCLSAMESGNSIPLDVRDDLSTPPSVLWPRNLYLFGTVNVDETTLQISDKVLDRAQVIDTSDIDLEPQISAWLSSSSVLEDAEKAKIATVVSGVWKILSGLEAHFGFRTARAIVRFIEEAKASSGGVLPIEAAIDMQMIQKVLVRLRGEGERWEAALTQVADLLKENIPGGRSEAVVRRMYADLERLGSFQFWH